MKINVEGGEVIAKALGMPGTTAKGPSHADGGLDVLVAPGATVFSKRVKRDGKTMAKRKEERDKEVNNKLKKLKDNPLDFLLVNALSRTIEVNAKEELEDLQIQESKQKKEEQTEEFSLGTGPWGVIPDLNSIFGGAPNLAGMIPGVGAMTSVPAAIPAPVASLPQITGTTLAQRAANVPIQMSEPQPYTAGDATAEQTVGALGGVAGMLGPVGAAIGMAAPLALTLMNRAGEARERNFMEGVGAEALSTQRQSFNAARMGRDRVNEEIELGRNAALSLPTTSINANRALRSTVTAQAAEANRKNEAQYQSALSSLLGERARMQGELDVRTREGASTAFTNQQHNRDTFYTNLAQNSTNIAQGLMFLANQRKKYTIQDLFK